MAAVKTGKKKALHSGTFSTLYRKLNPEQKLAVDTTEGPVVVIAGPGTGKTQILTLRIANILQKTDTPPDAILALTFTESAAFAMRRRLVDIVGSPAYRIHIHTFHGFCNDVIQRYPERFPRIIGSQSISDIDRVLLFEEIIKSEELDILRPFGDPLFYLRPALSAISSLKRENISPDDVSVLLMREDERIRAEPDFIHTKGAYKGKVKGMYQTLLDKIARTRELVRVFERYEKELATRRLYDFEDMILEVVRALQSDADFLLLLQEEYQYLLADEHQDANNAQNRLLELLSSFHPSPNLFVVGDEKQAIYRFQGASLQNFLYVTKRYPDALLIKLRSNYRSGQLLLDAAQGVITRGSASEVPLVKELRIPLIAAAATAYPVLVRAFSRSDLERLFVARDIRRLLDEGVPPAEIAVLYRNNRDAAALVEALERTGVPFVVESDENIMHDPDIRKLLLLMRTVTHFGEERLLFDLLHADFLGVAPIEMYKLARHRLRSKLSLAEILSSTAQLRAAKIAKPTKLRALFSLLSSFATLACNIPALEALEKMLDESGYIAHILLLPDAAEKLAKVNGLVDACKDAIAHHHSYTLAEVVNYLALLEAHDVSVRKDRAVLSPERVRLMTVHRSKGLEFEHVYIIGVEDARWGSGTKKSYFHLPILQKEGDAADAALEDDRRLFYVALTRARTQALVSYALAREDGAPSLPSQFIDELGEGVVRVDTAAFESGVSTQELLAPRQKTAHSLKDSAFLREIFLEQGLSVTALNNYLACPWRYFYSNLLRIPKAPDKYALFGNAVHAALRDLVSSIRSGAMLSREALIERFVAATRQQPFSEFDLLQAQKKGETVLGGYYDTYQHSWQQSVLGEYTLGVSLPLPYADLPSISLRGILDRIEFVSEREVVVYDYKTGKPKSRGEIEGTTKNGSGDYKRQLVFYKLLLESHRSGAAAGEAWRMLEGVIDFVEPDAKGRYHREHFTVLDEEVLQLREMLAATAREIYDLAFWERRCGECGCEYCALRELS